MACQRKQLRIIAHKYAGERGGQQKGGGGKHDACSGHQQHALFEHIFQFSVVSRAVVVADNGRCADGVADVDGDKDKLHIHQHAVCGDTVFTDIL